MAAKQHTVIYDGDCDFCTRQMRRLRQLDWRGSLRLLPISEVPGSDVATQLSPEALAQAIHCVTADGRVLSGARCLRFVSLRLPLLAPLALLLWIPGALAVAEWFYRRISANRHRLSRGGFAQTRKSGRAEPESEVR
jgi:predicted DCC family thiol-disulfide oxidoreductase YuxK